MTPSLILFFLLRHLPLLLLLPRRTSCGGGKWDMLLSDTGISAMHMQLLHTDRVVMFDRTDFGPSNISLPNGKCRRDPNDTALRVDCTAHSVEYDVASNSIRPLMVLTDVWCSSGAVIPDGTLVQAGGYNDGDHAVRTYKPCRDNSCDWQEISTGLTQRRWYATSQILPDGRQIIIGGRRQFNYEFYPKKSSADRSYNLPFLVQTNDPRIENNLYPFVFLNEDGNLFIFANNRAILFDYTTAKVVRTYPIMPGGDPRSYPSTGSAVMLPLKRNVGAEVLLCGGAPKGAYVRANNGDFVGALNTCGRIRITDSNPQWVMETMPSGRVMGDMLLLPNGNVLIINGASSGTAGWELGRSPVLSPVIYYPNNQVGSRFEVQNPTSTARMYHSTAILLRDGRVLVGGSNPHTYYNFTGILFPTDLTLQSFSPSYLDPQVAYLRPGIISPVSESRFGYGQQIAIRFSIPPGRLDSRSIMVTMIAPSFTTHSFSMNQRLLILDRGDDVVPVAKSRYQIRVIMPGSGKLAPAGYYLLFVVHRDIPSEGLWIHIQ
ncbi:glyoxal oxidase-related protein [Perilla frutescens var. hirtella]|uniref:Aldehyde oxidase GLOX n=1 Tax=Perilla frutescens var. hirtella TaxID=608512 RepID=A0AAD4IQ25_PERFH|nr:glyoxal oxidase-related protein [Perilla frutescens var. hirtella]